MRSATPGCRSRRGTIAEFAPAIFVFLLFAVFPLINLLGLATATGTVSLIATEAAGAAARSTNYSDALTAILATAASLSQSGFGRFARLQPQGGVGGSGANLFVVQTVIGSGNTTTYGPNTVVPPPIDSTSNIYEYSVQVTYQVQPFINMSSVPFIGKVPGIGAPTTLAWTVQRSVEYPDGLVGNGLSGLNPGGSQTPPITPAGGG